MRSVGVSGWLIVRQLLSLVGTATKTDFPWRLLVEFIQKTSHENRREASMILWLQYGHCLPSSTAMFKLKAKQGQPSLTPTHPSK